MSWQPVDAPVLLATKQTHRFFRDFIFHLSFSGALRWLSASWVMKDGLWICHRCFIGWKSGERPPTHLSPHKALSNKMLCAKNERWRMFWRKNYKSAQNVMWRTPERRQNATLKIAFQRAKDSILHPVWRPSQFMKMTLPDLKKYHKSLCSFPFCPKFMVIRQA